MTDEKDYTKELRERLKTEKHKHEEDIFFARRYDTLELYKNFLVPATTGVYPTHQPYYMHRDVVPRSRGKTFMSTETLREVMEEDRVDLFRYKETEFDLSVLSERVKPIYTYYTQQQYTHTVTMDITLFNNYKYGTMSSGPALKDWTSKYFGVGKQIAPEASESADEPVANFGNPCTKVFVYSERTNRMYKDRMRFWLTNPFKDDILACTETNS